MLDMQITKFLFGWEITIGFIHKGWATAHTHQNAGILKKKKKQKTKISKIFLFIGTQRKYKMRWRKRKNLSINGTNGSSLGGK